MNLGKVVGNVWATKKDEALNGFKLLIVKPLNKVKSGRSGFNDSIVAIDTVGAGIGETVIVSFGSSARYINGKNSDSPVDAAIIGIVDEIKNN